MLKVGGSWMILVKARSSNCCTCSKASPMSCRVGFEVGDGFDILDRLPGEFDIIFNDVGKAQYPTAFHKAIPRVRTGGYFISDNMLWGGRVANDPSHPTTQGVLELTRLLFQAPNLYTAILPVRDGVSVSLKLE